MQNNTETLTTDTLDISFLVEDTTSIIQSRTSGFWRCRTELTAEQALEALGCRYGIEDLDTDDPSEVIARSVVWTFHMPHGFGFDTTTQIEALMDLWTACDEEGSDLEAVAVRALREHRTGRLERLIEDSPIYVNKVLILDSVEVTPRWRGNGLGRRIAARGLYVAGASDTASLILAVAGPKPDAVEGYATLKVRAERLLEGLGLEEQPSGLWTGLCSMREPGSTIEHLV